MTNASEPDSLADTAEPRRKIVHSLPTKSPSPHNSPHPLTSNPSDDIAVAVCSSNVVDMQVAKAGQE